MAAHKGKIEDPVACASHAAHTLNPASLANLNPVKKGECRNPYGRRGKDGKGGFSFKETLKSYLSKLDQETKDNFYIGLFSKAAAGDVPAIKLLAELNDELTTNAQIDVGSGAQVVVMVPPIDKEPAIEEK